MIVGMRLIKKAVLMVLGIDCGVFLILRRGGRMMGVKRMSRVSSMNEFRSSAVSITFTWNCTKMGGS